MTSSRILMRTMTISAAMGGLLATAGPARAQSDIWGSAPAAYTSDDYRTSYADAQRTARDNGYRDGMKRGEEAVRGARALDIERERDYRNAENGYNRSLGDRNRYRDTYRGGFAEGYRDGYGRRGIGRPSFPSPPSNGRGWGGTASYGAYQNGTADGYKKGLDDLHDRKRADVERQKWYRSGDHDYDSRYGPRETYRIEYRRGFEEGYNRAYREARRY
jgi:hypothetical protein